MACKGENTSERPHRQSGMIVPNSPVTPVPVEMLQLAATLPHEEEKPTPGEPQSGAGLDLAVWITDHNLPVVASGEWNGSSGRGRKWVVNPCPFDAEHDNRSAVIIQHASGAITFRCLHNSCGDKDWHALRDKLEPGWRERWEEERLEWAMRCATWFLAEPNLDALYSDDFQKALDIRERHKPVLSTRGREGTKDVGWVKYFDAARKRHAQRSSTTYKRTRRGLV